MVFHPRRPTVCFPTRQERNDDSEDAGEAFDDCVENVADVVDDSDQAVPD